MGALPYQIDVAFEFEFQLGLSHRRLSEVALLPRELVWLPSDARLYVVDSGRAPVVEGSGRALAALTRER